MNLKPISILAASLILVSGASAQMSLTPPAAESKPAAKEAPKETPKEKKETAKPPAAAVPCWRTDALMSTAMANQKVE